MIRNSIATRLSMRFSLASALVIAAICFHLYSAFERETTSRNELLLTNMATLVRNMVEDIPTLDRLVEQPDIVGHVLDGHPRLGLWIYGENGRTLFASAGTAVPRHEWEDLAAPAAAQLETRLWRPGGRLAYRLAATRFSSEGRGIGDGVIVLALDVSDDVKLLRLIQASLLTVIPAGTLAAVVIGILIVRRELRPFARIAGAARKVTANQLTGRLDSTGVPAELQDLVRSFNTMLERLDGSFRRLSEFSADVAHDLRTPLSSLLGRTQAVLLQKRSADEYRRALEANVETAERMSALIADMLFLAQADDAQSALAHERIDLREEAERLTEYFGIESERRGIVLEVRGHAAVLADRALIQRALGNLLSNAIRHSPEGGRVVVALARELDAVTVSVTDAGPGIPPAHASRIFDRFYRPDASRTRTSGGTGLGLAITRSIMRMHHGEASLRSEPGKATTFTLAFPASLDLPAAEARASADASAVG